MTAGHRWISSLPTTGHCCPTRTTWMERHWRWFACKTPTIWRCQTWPMDTSAPWTLWFRCLVCTTTAVLDTLQVCLYMRRRKDFIHHFVCLPYLARDCLYLGKSAFNNGYFGSSIEWFEEALARAHVEGNSTASVEEITPFYQMAVEYVSWGSTGGEPLRPLYLTAKSCHSSK